ncbi:hypothetical protein SAMN04487840_10366 [Streptococcus gallolyticus]|uniref:Uncharacterized protein n=1 Tax=Streptococcus gallolyticus TaxID=315405 RepID=A0A1H9NGB6_9STRE|nr:hypothetical protein SAMN04487840_10366 [Streptococcus gallolyticus]
MSQEIKRHINLWSNLLIWLVMVTLGSTTYIVCYTLRITK